MGHCLQVHKMSFGWVIAHACNSITLPGTVKYQIGFLSMCLVYDYSLLLSSCLQVGSIQQHMSATYIHNHELLQVLARETRSMYTVQV